MSPPATGVFSCTAWCWGVLVYYSPLAGLSSIYMCSHTHTIRTSGYTGINSYTGWKEWLEGKMNVKLYKYDVLDQERKVKGIARIMKKMCEWYHEYCRYLDIFMGLLLLLSMLSLLYGSYYKSSIFVIVFLASSMAVAIIYWCWYFYIKYAIIDYPVFEEQVGHKISSSKFWLELENLKNFLY